MEWPNRKKKWRYLHPFLVWELRKLSYARNIYYLLLDFW